MMLAVRGSDTPFYTDLMEDVWRFRHEQFVERLGWSGIRREDGREIDQFDHEEAIHLPITNVSKVVGYSRLLPTTRPHLLTDIYPEILQGAAGPSDPAIFEWTRCIGTDEVLDGFDIAASNVMSAGVAEYCIATGIRSLLVETHPKLAHHLTELGWDVRPLHVPTLYEGRPFVAIFATPSQETIKRSRTILGIRKNVLSLSLGSVANINAAKLPPIIEPHLATGHEVRLANGSRQGWVN